MDFKNDLAYALGLDKEDELGFYRDLFHLPLHNGKPKIYFTGNSLGLQPKTVINYLQEELADWASMGGEGHFEAKRPWYPYHELFPSLLTGLIGCKPEEVVVMNSLTVNLHLLMVSFYRPTKSRFKIICEYKAFPSDQYAIESQVRFHGFDQDEAIIEVKTREGEHSIRDADILQAIQDQG